MKFKDETKSVPTFRQWIKENQSDDTRHYPVVRILDGDKWDSITPICKDFRYPIKFETREGYSKASRFVSKTCTSQCVAILVISPDGECEFELSKAGDTCENPQRFRSVGYGWDMVKDD